MHCPRWLLCQFLTDALTFALSWRSRLYGPRRLRMLTRGYKLVARVWGNVTVAGGWEAVGARPKLFAEIKHGRAALRGALGVQDWQHQPVLVLQRDESDPLQP